MTIEWVTVRVVRFVPINGGARMVCWHLGRG